METPSNKIRFSPSFPEAELPADIAQEIANVASTLEPLRSSGEIPDEPSGISAPRARQISGTRIPKQLLPYLKPRMGRPKKKKKPKSDKPHSLNPIDVKLARKISDRVNKAINPKKLEKAQVREAITALESPFDPTNPITTDERTLASIAKNDALARDAYSWQERLDSEVIKSIEAVVDLRDNAISESVRFHAAKDILDRAGADKRKTPNAPLKPYEQQTTEELIAEMARLEAIDAEFTEVAKEAPAAQAGKDDRGTGGGTDTAEQKPAEGSS